jgi:hypothetical protein
VLLLLFLSYSLLLLHIFLVALNVGDIRFTLETTVDSHVTLVINSPQGTPALGRDGTCDVPTPSEY